MTNSKNNHKKKWLVFYTRARSEKVCEAQLKIKGIQVFLPKCIKVRQWKDRKKKVILPLFPNYIFALVDEYERIEVLESPGIVRNLIYNQQMVEISSAEIEQINLMQMQPGSLQVMASPRPKRGEKIRINEGPMEGLEGEILEHYGSTHLLVRINSINQAVKVKLPAVMVADPESSNCHV
ncbi:MAG: UpxY family transcription antiterminator [Balneolales bacterium]